MRQLRQQGMLYRQRGVTFTGRIPDERANERCSMLLGRCLGMSAKRWRLGRGIDPLPSTAFPGRSSGTTNVAAAAVLVLAAVDTPSDAIGHSTDVMWRWTWRQAQHRAWHRQQALAVRRQESTANSTERELAGGRMAMILNFNNSLMKLRKGLKETQQSATREDDDDTARRVGERTMFNVAWDCR